METTLPHWIVIDVEVQTDVLTPIQGFSSVLKITQTRQSKLHDCADRAKKVWLRRAVKVGWEMQGLVGVGMYNNSGNVYN